MITNEERMRRAKAAGKQAGTSPYQREERKSATGKVYLIASYTFETMIGVWLSQHHAPWWMQTGWWAMVVSGAFLLLVFGPLARKAKRRSMLMAREQVHQVRKLAQKDPASLGLGLLLDADPTLDHLSAEAGVRFALATVESTLDGVKADTPAAKWFGIEFDDEGKVKK